jgi:hypothetical protein
MNYLNELRSRPWFFHALAGVIAGLVIGLLYAWILNPVEWENTEVNALRPDLKEDFLRAAIESYSVNLDGELALDRYERLGDEAREIFDAIGENPGDLNPNAIQSFQALLTIAAEVDGSEGDGEPAPTEARPVTEPEASNPWLVPACIGVAALGALVVGFTLLNRRGGLGLLRPSGREREETVAMPAGVDLGRTMPTNEPLATFRTIYNIGDDLYDDSFSIESPSGDFLGECGVGIGDVIGVGDPSKVSAFEVWLFDKNDIQTVTKVLMSNYGFNDESTRNRLTAKGDPVLAQPGGMIELETASLEIEARVVDLTYGEGALPAESFFERITIEMRAWPRGANRRR